MSEPSRCNDCADFCYNRVFFKSDSADFFELVRKVVMEECVLEEANPELAGSDDDRPMARTSPAPELSGTFRCTKCGRQFLLETGTDVAGKWEMIPPAPS